MTKSTPSWGPALVSHRHEAYDVHKNYGTEMGGQLDPSSEKPPMESDYPMKVKYVPAKTQDEADMA